MLPKAVPLLPESVLAASWVHAMLFILEIVLAIRYFSKFSGHRRFDFVVGALVVNAIVLLFATCAHAWKILIIHRVTPPKVHAWPFSLMIIGKNVAAIIGQGFLLYRYYGLSRSMFWTAIVLIMMALHLAAGFAIAIDFLVHPQFGQPLASMARVLSFCINAATDIIIPMLIIWELRKIRTAYSDTQGFIHRIIVNAASAGCCVSLAEIFILILFWTLPRHVLLGCNILGPFYGITVLLNLFVCHWRGPLSTVKTGNLTTLDTAQLQGSVPSLESQVKESTASEGTGNDTTDFSVTNSPLSLKF